MQRRCRSFVPMAPGGPDAEWVEAKPEQLPTGFQHAAQLGKQRLEIRHRISRMLDDDGLHAVAFEWQVRWFADDVTAQPASVRMQPCEQWRWRMLRTPLRVGTDPQSRRNRHSRNVQQLLFVTRKAQPGRAGVESSSVDRHGFGEDGGVPQFWHKRSLRFRLTFA